MINIEQIVNSVEISINSMIYVYLKNEDKKLGEEMDISKYPLSEEIKTSLRIEIKDKIMKQLLIPYFQPVINDDQFFAIGQATRSALLHNNLKSMDYDINKLMEFLSDKPKHYFCYETTENSSTKSYISKKEYSKRIHKLFKFIKNEE